MGVKVRIPTPLRKYTDDQAEVDVDGATVGEVLTNMEAKHEGIRQNLVDEAGEVRRFVNVYVNDEDIRFLDGTGTSLKDGDSLTIVPAIAGGCR